MLAQAGDYEAFAVIVQHYRLPVIQVVFRMCANSHLAEDAAQEAFIRCWKHLPQYQFTGSFRAWLYRMALNAAYDLLRREKKMVNLDGLQLAGDINVEQLLANQQQKAEIQRAILQLPQAGRIVLILREYDQMSYREIAETLEIPIGTVMSRLNYARKTLYQKLQPVQEVL